MIPFMDLRISDKRQRMELLSALEAVFNHGQFILGPEVEQFEEKIAKYCSRKFAISVNSGTDALFLGLKSLGIGPGDEVITTALSWIATANAISMTGATPVFADINDDLNIDPLSIEQLITPKTKVIMPVHYAGKMCRMDELLAIAGKYNLMLLEDASQAFSARFKNSVAGSFGTMACFSMNPMKVLPALGEAGMILTDDETVMDRLVSLRYNGMVNQEVCVEVGLNCRIDTIQAAILLKQLDRVSSIIKKRRKIARFYDENIVDIVKVPIEMNDQYDVYYTYTIQTEKRNALKVYLESKGIEAKIRDPYLIPQQPAYNDGTQGKFLNAQRLVKKLLCLPIHEKMSRNDYKYVVKCIEGFFR